MDVLREMREMLWESSSSTSSSSEDEGVVNRRRGERRMYRSEQRCTVDDFDDIEFHRYFRLSKAAFAKVLAMVRADLDGDPRRTRELTAENKLLAVLRFFACGNFQQTAADYVGISQPTMANILPQVRAIFCGFFVCLM